MSSTTLRTMIVAALISMSATSAHAGCYDCSPQCVPAARSWSGVNFPAVAYAKDIINAARNNPKFRVYDEPRDHSVGVIALGTVGHAIAVLDSQRDGKDRKKLLVAHANADCRCTSERVSATFSKGTITFSSGMLKGKSYKTLGFVANA